MERWKDRLNYGWDDENGIGMGSDWLIFVRTDGRIDWMVDDIMRME